MPPKEKKQGRVSQRDRVVAVMGPTGAGKSTFIAHATRQGDAGVGHSLHSYTKDVQAVRTSHPVDNYPVVFVDTPGFDDTVRSDIEILALIADWLKDIYEQNLNLATIVYLHRISDNRMTGSARKNIQLLFDLCGQDHMPQVVLVTTMWGDVRTDVGIRREQDLKKNFWGSMLADGCKIERFADSFESAWDIVGNLSDKHWSKTEKQDNKLRAQEISQRLEEMRKQYRKAAKKKKSALRRFFSIFKGKDK